MNQNSLTVTDNRTGKHYELPITPNTIQAMDLRQIKVREDDFGHRVYKNYDPRARIIESVADEVLAITGKNPLLDIAQELEKIALDDDYFVERQLYPNVDFYSGLIYQAIGFPVEMFPVLFAVARTAGWLAQWQEMLTDEDQKIARPRQVYTGHGTRDYIALEQRVAA